MAEEIAGAARGATLGGLPRGKARNHTALVRILRILLPVTMGGMVAVLAVLVGSHAIRRQQAAHQDASTPIRMINPHFYGRDNQGRAYTLGARQAARDEKAFQTVLLDFPVLILGVDAPKPTTLTADSGVYHEDTRMLMLRGHIRANDPKIASFATNEALVNTKTGDVTGGGALASQTSVGAVAGRSFEVKDKGDRVIFKGGVHARLNRR